MDLLYVSHHREYRSWHRPGAFARGMVARGHRVTMVVTDDVHRRGTRVHDVDGVRVVRTPDVTTGRLRSGWDPTCAVRRARWLDRDDFVPDVVHLFETRPATVLPGLRAARRHDAPVVTDWNDWWGRGGLVEINRPGWYRRVFGGAETWFEEHFRPGAAGTTVISRALADRASAIGCPPGTVVHVRPGIDVTRFTPRPRPQLRAQLGFASNDVVIGYASQDTYFDVEPMVEGIAATSRRLPQVRLLLLGQRDPRMDELVARAGLEGRTVRCGWVPDDDYPAHLGVCDLFAVPFPDLVHNRGRWPNKFGDFVATGRPVVFNPFGDLADFASDPPGIACPATAVGFAAAFDTLVRDPALRAELGARARELAVREFAWKDRLDVLEATYHRVAEEHRPTRRRRRLAA